MIALTQEKRAELVVYNTGKLQALNYNIEQTESESLIKHLGIEIQSTKIALASLTAGKLSKDASESLIAMVEYALSHRICMGMDEGFKSFDPEIEHDFVQEIRDFIASGGSIFTAPPVPEIKFPPKQEGQHHCLPSDPEDVWNECLVEIKRLNGLGD